MESCIYLKLERLFVDPSSFLQIAKRVPISGVHLHGKKRKDNGFNEAAL